MILLVLQVEVALADAVSMNGLIQSLTDLLTSDAVSLVERESVLHVLHLLACKSPVLFCPKMNVQTCVMSGSSSVNLLSGMIAAVDSSLTRYQLC
jgi:hypothetical protein